MNKKYVLPIIFVLMLATIGIVCASKPYPPVEKPLISSSIVEPMYYGNNTWYFDCTGAKFRFSLSAFIGDHPELEVTAVTPDASGLVLEINGYTVITRQIEPRP